MSVQPEETERRPSAAHIYVVMGVAGSGKTTVGTMLAEKLGAQFCDADEFHSLRNKQKMAAGIALTDEDRQPWLLSMRAAIEQWQQEGSAHVLACSALKQIYRQSLRIGPIVQFIYLQADRDLARRRLEARSDHYMKINMVDSQFDALEEPTQQEALIVEAQLPAQQVVRIIVDRLGGTENSTLSSET